MNILGVGGWELLAILIIMLIVAGPRRMLQWSYILGKYLGYMRVMWRDMMQSLQKEFDQAGVDLQVPKDIPTRRDINRFAQSVLDPITTPIQESVDEVNTSVKELRDSVSTNQPSTNGKASEQTGADSQDSGAQKNFGTWSGS